jgi:hypothetical protein
VAQVPRAPNIGDMIRKSLLRLGLTATLTAALLAPSAAHAAGGCAITSVGKAQCGYRSAGVQDVYTVAAMKWAITVNGTTIRSSAKGSAPAGAFKAPKGANVRLLLLSPGSGVIA